MAATDAGLSSLALATYSNSTYYSTYFPATGSYLTGSNAIFNVSATTVVWNFECWVYPVTGTGHIFAIGSGAVFGNSIIVTYGVLVANKFGIIQSNGSSNPVSLSTTNTYALGNWYHIAVSRTSAGVIKIFVNGVQDATVTYNTAGISAGTTFVVNGAYDNNGLGNGGGNFYLSNLRFMVGGATPLYTANFNAPVAQLTAIANTSLLICNTNSLTDGSVNNFAITRAGNPGFKQFTPALLSNASVTLTPSFTTGTRTYTFSAPSNVTAISVTPTLVDPALATMKFNANVALTSGQSNIASAAPIYNNGYSETFTAGLLQYANAAPVNTQGYSWTVEMWVNPTGNYANHNVLFAKRVTAAGGAAFEGYLVITTGYISFYNGTVYNSTYALTPNVWSHVAYTYDGSILTIYVNGNRVYSVAVAITDNTEPLTIGGARGLTEWMIGNISNFRMVKGYQIYTQSFTPPTQPLGSTQSSSTGVRAITGSPANGNSMFVTGQTVQWISFPAGTGTSGDLGAGDFTLECWTYLISRVQLYPTIFDNAGSLGNTNRLALWAGHNSINTTNYNGYVAGANMAFSTPVIYNAWVHLALVRVGTTITLYVNGKPDTTTFTSSANLFGITAAYVSGVSTDINTMINGYVSNIRIVKGTALYTSNFLVTTSPLTAITNTVFLGLQTTLTSDASTLNSTITTSGTPKLSTIGPFSGGTGSNQYLSTSLAYQYVQNPYNPSISLGQGHNNFTAECWVYLNTLPPAAPGWFLIQKGVGSTSGLEWSFSVTSTGLYFQTASGIPTGTTTSTAFTANITAGQWMHLALTKVGTSINIWFNGIYTGTVNTVNNLYYGAAATSYVTIANSSTGSTTAFNGFISNARVVYGKAVYTTDVNIGFTPSTTALTTTQSSTATTASIDNASSYVVANGSSVYFNNTNDFLTFPEPSGNFYSGLFNGTSSRLDLLPGTFGANDFTIEFWYYANSNADQQFFNNLRWFNGLTPGSISLTYQSSSTSFSLLVYSGAGSDYNYAPTTAISPIVSASTTIIGKWTHLAISRVGATIYLAVNGIVTSSALTSNTALNLDATQTTYSIGGYNYNGGGPGQWANGYISNFRIVKGTGLYSTGFTPSTSPLTRTSQGVSASQVSLLTLQSSTIIDNSINAIAITNIGAVTTSQNIPFVGSFTDVTIEAWVLLNAAPTTRGWIINNNAASTGYFGIAIEAARTITIFSDNNATAVLTSAKLVPLNTWTHIAVVLINGNIYTYINGWRDTNTVVKTTVWGAATPGTVYVGRQASAAAQYFPGYITNLHVVYNTALYTTKFSVPTSPVTAITNTQFLGLQSSVTLDSSSSNRTITKGAGSAGLLLSPMTSPFTTYIPSVANSYSMAFGWGTASNTDGVSVALTSVSSTILTGDFTIEVWAYLELMPTTAAVFISSTASTYSFNVSSTGLLTFSPGLVGTTVIAPKTWYHLAVTRQQNVAKLWINGILEASVTITGSLTAGGANYLNIGFSDSPANYFYGYMNNLRVIPGRCIYTGNFTPSTVPYSLTSSGSTNTLAVTGLTTYPAVGNPTGINYSGSVFLDANGSTTTPNSGRYELSTFDFTIEGWFYCNAITGANVIMGQSQNVITDRAWKLYVTKSTANTGYLQFDTAGGFSSTAISISSALITINLSQWYHCAVVRIGSVITLYLNGSAVATQTLTTTNYMLGISTQVFTIGNETGAASYFYGYLSNLRMIRGYGIYTGTFTPSTTALTNTQASGTNIIALGNAIPALGNSVYFNGTTDYMKAPGSTTTMGTGDFTIETYYFPTSFVAVTTLFGQYTAATTALGYWNVQITTAGIITVYYNGSANFTASTAILVNEWAHIALVRISGTITLYVNGVSYGTVSFATQFGLTSVASPLYIGATQLSGPASYAVGYMSNLRIVKGVGVYTSAFTVPTGTLSSTQSSGTNITAITGTSTSLLLYQNSPFTDNSTFNNPITGFGNPQYSPVFSPSFFTYPTPTNGNSGYFNGTSNFLSLTQPSNASTNDFTIELWVYPTSIAAIGYLLSTSTITANCYHLWITTTGTISLAVDSATASITSASPSLAKVGAWTHIAITRTSGVIYMYINGYRQATTLTKATQFGDTGVLNVGRYQPTPGQYFSGYITNVRFVYGTPAVYIGNPYNTPPYASPLTAITNTTLLLLQSTLTKDNSTNNVTVTNTGVILSTYTNPYTMMKMPVLLTAQVGTPGTNFRDNSMYGIIFSANSTAVGYHPTVSPFGIAPLILLGQTLNNIHTENSIGNYTLATNTTTIMPYVTPFNGNAIAFNGSTQYVTGTSLHNSLGGDFTIEFFMMAGPQTATTGALLLGKKIAYSPATNNNFYIMCSHSGYTQQTIQIYYAGVSGNLAFLGSTPVCTSTWNHVAIVRIKNIVKVYVNGVLDSSLQNSFTDTNVWDYSNYTIGSNPSDGGATVAQLAYNGMLSNLRIINGTGVYTGTFTPPTNALTTSQASRTNVVAYTPTAPSSSGNSLQFNGTTNTYVAINPSVGLSLYLNDYTIEFWHYLTGRPTGSTTPCLFSNYSSYAVGSLSMFAGHNSSDITKYQIAFNGLTFPATALVSNTSIIYGKWTHIAVVRKSGIVYLYINGILDSYSIYGNYNVTSISATSYQWFVGGVGDALTTSYISGFISNFRVVNGIAVYSGSNTSTANFTVPVAALTATQSSGTNIAAISNSLVSNGGAIYFPVTQNAYQTIPSVILTPGTYDWTVEGWIFFNAMPSTDTWAAGSVSFFGSDSVNAADGTHCVIGQTQMFVAVTNTKYGTVAHGMSVYNWYHIAYVKISNTVYFYVNGVQLGSVSSVPTNGTATTSYIGTAAGSTSYVLNGYISNLRVVKYLGIYTGMFPALTSPLALTQNAVTTVSAITGTNTSVLALQNSATTDASSNNFTLTAVGSPIVNTSIVPFVASNGYSVYFNGTTDYLQLPQTSSPVTAPAGQFTIEAWIYCNNISTGAVVASCWYFGTATSCSWTFGLTNTGYLNFAYGIGATNASLNGTSQVVPSNAWTHVAITRNSSNVITLYVNGVADSTTITVSGTLNTNPSQGVRIGSQDSASHGWLAGFQGYISNFRFVNGVSVYTGAFTPPTSPLTITQGAGTNITAITGTSTSILMLQNSVTTDASTNAFSVTTVGAPVRSSSIPLFTVTNGSSVFFNGASNYITAPSDTAFAFGTGDFTIEGWIYLTSNTGTIYDGRTGATTVSPQLYVNSNIVYYAVGGTVQITGSALTASTWYHVAVSRISGVTTLYINGAKSGSSYTDTNNYVIGSPYVGAGYSYSFPLTGYISNLRVVKGVGVYTTVFTVPAIPLTSTQASVTPVTALSSPSANGYSVNLNGTSQYLTVPQSTAVSWQFGTGDFTVEFWIRTTDTDGYIIAPLNDNGTGNSGYWAFKLATSTLIWQSVYNVSSLLTISTPSIIDGIWHHIAVVRISGTTSIYIDGIQAGSAADATNYTFVNSGLQIGSDSVRSGATTATRYTYGLLSNIRIVKGVGVYTGNFALPVTPLTATQSAGTNITAITGTGTQLLAIQNSLTTDASTNNTILTAVNSPALSAIGPFTTSATAANGYSVNFNGSTQYISVPINSVFNFTGDFTIEAWINMPVVSGGPYSIFGMYSAPNWFDFRLFNNVFQVSLNAGSGTNIGGSITAANTWTHVALVRIGGSIKCYVNGVVTGTTLTNSATLGYPSVAATLGRSGTANYFSGYISNLRVVMGVGVYLGNFTPSTTPLTATQSAGTNIAAITGTSTALLALQNSLTTDGSTNNFTLTPTASPVLNTGSAQSPFNVTVTNSGVVLLTAQSGIATDSAIGYPITNTNGLYQNAITPFGIQVPVTLLTAQSNIANVDNSTANITSYINATGANVRTSNVYGPFNNDASLLTFQSSLIADYSNNRAQVTTVGAGVSPTDSSPFTTSKSLTSLLVPYGYVDTSYANAVIANTANSAVTNFTINPFSIPSTLVSVLGLQTSNTVLESGISNSTFTTSGTAPTSNTSSPFGTYPASGLITLNTSATTGIVGNVVNYANILVTAGDAVTTNAYSITINTSLLANIGDRNSVDTGTSPILSNANITISDVASSNINEATLLSFATPTISVLTIDTGVNSAPSNATFSITDVANSNISETLSSIFINGVRTTVLYVDTGLPNVAVSNVTFSITDVANSNISETIASVTISNVSSSRSIQDTGTQPTPSPVGGTVLFPTYAYTDGVKITAANVESGGGGGTFVSNQQIWYQG